MADQGLGLSRARRDSAAARDGRFLRRSSTPISVPLGVNTFFDQEVEEAKVRKSLQLIKDAGFQWIRQEFPWEDIEKPAKGQYWETKFNYSTWIKYDRIVNLAQEYGLQIVARLDHPPAWTRADGRARGDFAPPDNYDDYGDFVATVVDRYRGRIRFYQLWNEPNIYPEWGEQDPNAKDYSRLLKIGYTRAKATDPNAVIVSAGLAQTVETEGRYLRRPRSISSKCTTPACAAISISWRCRIMGCSAGPATGAWTSRADQLFAPDSTARDHGQERRCQHAGLGNGDRLECATGQLSGSTVRPG